MIVNGIDTEKDELERLTEISIPSNPTNPTRWRWATEGVRGVVLATVMVGGIRYTTRKALKQFFDEENKDNPTYDARKMNP